MSAPLLSVTPNAVKRLKELLSLKKEPLALRVYVIGGGCSGMQYGFKFEQPNAEDILIETDGVSLIIDPFSSMYLTGSQVDYKSGLTGSSFSVANPNAVTTCSCGSSFSVSGFD